MLIPIFVVFDAPLCVRNGCQLIVTRLPAGEPAGLAIVGDLVFMQPTVISPNNHGCRTSSAVTALSSTSAAEVGCEVEMRHRIGVT